MSGLVRRLTSIIRLLCLVTLWINKAFSEATYLGCYVVRDDPSLGETLGGVDQCVKYCDEGKNAYAAMWKWYCLCAAKMDGLQRDEEGCTIACDGNSTLLCGGPNSRISVYEVRPVAKSGILPIYAWCLIGGAGFIIVVIIIGTCFAKSKLKSWDDNKPDPEHRNTVENAYDSLPSRRSYRYQQVSETVTEPAEPIANSNRVVRDTNVHDGETEEEDSSTELETAASVYDLSEGQAPSTNKPAPSTNKAAPSTNKAKDPQGTSEEKAPSGGKTNNTDPAPSNGNTTNVDPVPSSEKINGTDPAPSGINIYHLEPISRGKKKRKGASPSRDKTHKTLSEIV